MAYAPTSPLCVGITTPAPTTFPTTDIAGHAMVNIPGGLTVIGSGKFQDNPPRWVQLSPYRIAETETAESLYQEVMGHVHGRLVSNYHGAPGNLISHSDAIEYLKKRRGGLTLPTEAQWENAARGPAVNIPQVMEQETGRFRPGDVTGFAYRRFENFVFEVGGAIYNNCETEIFQRLVKKGRPFFGWRVHGTPSGRLDHCEAWFDRDKAKPVHWGPKNAYGLYNMTGNLWEWVQDWYVRDAHMLGGKDPAGPGEGEYRIVRGGSWANSESGPMVFRAAYRSYGSGDNRFGGLGFRAAAPQKSVK